MTKKLSYTNRFPYLRGKVDWEEQELTIVETLIVEGLLSKKEQNPHTHTHPNPPNPAVATRSGPF